MTILPLYCNLCPIASCNNTVDNYIRMQMFRLAGTTLAHPFTVD